MNKVIVSIITPVFNSKKHIDETIQSVISQTFVFWEFILVDDGSTDGSQEIIQSYISKEKRIRFYQRYSGNKGASACRNIGLKKASGLYVIFLDSDDLLDPVCLEKRTDYMKKNPALDFAVFQMSVYNSCNDKTTVLTHKKDSYLHAFLKHDLPWTMTSPIWKTEFLHKIGGFREYYPRLQDPELHTRALLIKDISYEVLHESIPDCFYRQNSNKVNLEILLTGYKCYLNDFALLLKDNKEFQRSLKISQKSAMNHIIRRFKNENKKKIYSLTKQINKECHENKILNKRIQILNNILIYSFIFIFPANSNFIKLIHLKVLNKLL